MIGLLLCIGLASAKVTKLTDDNRDLVLTGEWFIKAYAPWCGACKSIAASWTQLGEWSLDKEYNIAEIDITAGHNFANELLVTKIPSLFHVKNGVWTSYSGARNSDAWKKFLTGNGSEGLEPMPWYRKPGSQPMRILSYMMGFALKVQEMHERLTKQYNVPTPLSVGILILLPVIALITLFLMVVYFVHIVLGKPKPASEIGKQRARKRTLSTQPAEPADTSPAEEETKKDQ